MRSMAYTIGSAKARDFGGRLTLPALAFNGAAARALDRAWQKWGNEDRVNAETPNSYPDKVTRLETLAVTLQDHCVAAKPISYSNASMQASWGLYVRRQDACSCGAHHDTLGRNSNGRLSENLHGVGWDESRRAKFRCPQNHVSL